MKKPAFTTTKNSVVPEEEPDRQKFLTNEPEIQSCSEPNQDIQLEQQSENQTLHFSLKITDLTRLENPFVIYEGLEPDCNNYLQLH